MKTTKKPGRPAGQSRSEIQVVGYLTRPALLAKLGELVEDGTIGHFWAVPHPPDEDVKKEHWHVRMTPPPSRAVVWADVLARVVEQVPGEQLPRRLVASSGAVNDRGLDGLLYARHDRRYCARKGLKKATLDFPREQFETDCPEWLDGLWNESENYDPAPRRSTVEDILAMVERNPRINDRELLRTCLVSGVNKGQFDMLREYRQMIRRDGARQDFDRRLKPEPPPPEQSEFDLNWNLESDGFDNLDIDLDGDL